MARDGKINKYSNAWNDKWYTQLRKQAVYVLRGLDYKNVEPEELVNVAWVNYVRFFDKKVDDLRYTRYIRFAMRRYLILKNKSFGCQLVSEDLKSGMHRGFESVDNWDEIEDKAKRMSADSFRLLYLRLHEQRTYEEIGKILGVTKQAVAVRVSRIKKALKKD